MTGPKHLGAWLIHAIRNLLPDDDRDAALVATGVAAELCVATGINDDDALVAMDAALRAARERGAGEEMH